MLLKHTCTHTHTHTRKRTTAQAQAKAHVRLQWPSNVTQENVHTHSTPPREKIGKREIELLARPKKSRVTRCRDTRRHSPVLSAIQLGVPYKPKHKAGVTPAYSIYGVLSCGNSGAQCYSSQARANTRARSGHRLMWQRWHPDGTSRDVRQQEQQQQEEKVRRPPATADPTRTASLA